MNLQKREEELKELKRFGIKFDGSITSENHPMVMLTHVRNFPVVDMVYPMIKMSSNKQTDQHNTYA